MHCLESKIVQTETMKVRYSLIAEELWEGVVSYGISVELMDERVILPCITTSRKNAEGLFAALVRGLVTPVTVHDVIEDWLLR